MRMWLDVRPAGRPFKVSAISILAAASRPSLLDDDGDLHWASTRWSLEEQGLPDTDIELRARGG